MIKEIHPNFCAKTAMTSRFDDHPFMNYINLYESSDRRDFMERQFEEYGITKHKVFSVERYDDQKNSFKVSGRFVDSVNHHGTNITFMRCIKHWLETTDEEYGIFLEDDISFENSKYWTFTWSEFVNSLPENWDVVQPIRLNDWSDGRTPTLSCRPRNWDDWGATCLIKREYAKKIVSAYMVSDTEYFFDIAGTDLMPIVENLLFCGGGHCMNAPLFFEHELPSTYNRECDAIHALSRQKYADLWRTDGLKTKISDLYS
jgi:hypothetical protein